MILRSSSAKSCGRHLPIAAAFAAALPYLAVYAVVSFAWAAFVYSVIRSSQ